MDHHCSGRSVCKPSFIQDFFGLTGSEEVPFAVTPDLYPGVIVIAVRPLRRIYLTGRYAYASQIVLDRQLHGQAIYPPINVLPSLSRLMKDGIGEGYTRADHQDVANQLFSCYAKVGDARALASVIGEDELSPLDKRYLVFGKAFESEFVGQSETGKSSKAASPFLSPSTFFAFTPELFIFSCW